MTDYVTHWWERTGRMTEWVEHPGGGRSRSTIFRCIATGEEKVAGDLPIGALYALEREHGANANAWPPAGYDGLAIACVCIGNGPRTDGKPSRHHWYIDYRASNCTMPNDKDHRCWVRHGSVGDKLTVDKAGNTCGAGAGSFYMDDMKWHGFLRNGMMVQA